MGERSNDSDQQARAEAFDWLLRMERTPDDPAVTAAFRAWLARRADHVVLHAQVRRVWQAAPHLPPALAGKWPDRASSPSRRPLIGRRQWLIGAAAAASVAAFAAGSLTDLWADYRTGTGETKTVTLADGSLLQLDTDSAVHIAYEPHKRGIELLRGRAFFEVARDAARPFAVLAGAFEARALGTRFEVRRDEASVSVLVVEGSVAVGLSGRSLPERAPLGPGEALIIDLATAAAREMTVAATAIGAWRERRLVVEGWSVAAVLDELGRYHRGMILLRDEALGARLVSGTYDLGRPVEAVRAVAHAQDGAVTAIGPWLLVVSAR